MKSLQKLTLLCLLTGLVACQPNEKVTEKIIEKPIENPVKEKLVKIDESMTDDELADAGEQLMLIHTVPLAEKAFNMALIKNPDNLKAQFYTEGFLKNYTVFKGILTRIKPLVRSQGKIKELEKSINEIPNIPLRKFLLDGKEDIATLADIQVFLTEQQTNWNNFRKWLIKNYDKTLTLNLDPFWLVVNAGVESRHTCEIIDEKEGKAICNYNNVFQKKLSPADLMGLRQMVAGQVLFYNFYTAYSFEGFDKLAKFDPQGRLTAEQKYNYLVAVAPNTLTLREKNLMKETLHIGADLAQAVKYAVQYKDQLCPKGPGQVRQRPGFLIHDGICVEKHEEALEKLELALNGIMTVKMEKNTQTYWEPRPTVDVKVDFFAWFRNPVKDLKSLGPVRYNECGEGEGLMDKTFGGFFVEGNAEDFISQSDCSKTKKIDLISNLTTQKSEEFKLEEKAQEAVNSIK
jgi:hypothetical protein